MADKDAAAVLTEALSDYFVDVLPIVADCLAALTEARIACVYVPEGVEHGSTVYGCDVPGHPNNHTHQHYAEVEHGARLVGPHWIHGWGYLIEPPEKEVTP